MRASWLMVLACVAQAQAPMSPSDALRRAIRDTTLANGLTVIAIENHAVPLVTVDVTVKTGSFTQAPGDEGVPHLYEHMLFKSFTADNGRAFQQEVGRLDGQYNGSTSEESVNYWVMVPSENLGEALGLMAQLVRDPVFTDDDLLNERLVVLDEVHRDLSDPLALVERQVDQQLWTTSWGRKNPLGDTAALMAATPKTLTQIFRRYYVPNNAAVVVSGDMTATQVFAGARSHFGRWARRPDPFVAAPVPPIAPLSKSAAVILEGDVRDVVLFMKWQGPSVTENPTATYAADVLSTILDASGSTFQATLVDNGLFSSCSIDYLTLAHVGPITLVAHTSLDSLAPALTALWDRVSRLGSFGAFTDEELADAREARRVAAAFELDDGNGMAHTAAYWWSVAGLDYFKDYTDSLQSIDRAAIDRFVQRYIAHRPFVVGMLVPKGQGQAVRAVIAGILPQLQVTAQ
jgi:zinc protease